MGDFSVADWYSPNWGSPDYFCPCNHTACSVPQNAFGWQYARTGKKYVGIYLYDSYWYLPADSLYDEYREYIQCQLLDTLISENKYQISFYVSLGNKSRYALKHIGAYLSDDTFYQTSVQPLPFIPQIASNNYIADTANWVLISGDYIAQGGEKILTIGNFQNSLAVDTVDSTAGWPTYYYIDDVSLKCLTCSVKKFDVNVITPNGDGINDFINFSTYGFKKMTFNVYNRWGTKVFNSDNTKLKWGGETNTGKQLNDGTYYYILQATLQSKEQITKHNYITIFNH